MSGLAVPSSSNAPASTEKENGESYGKTSAPPIRPPASVPEITAVQGLVPVLQYVGVDGVGRLGGAWGLMAETLSRRSTSSADWT